METSMFKMNVKKWSFLLFIPLMTVQGCDQGSPTSSTDSAERVTLAPNEHNRAVGDYIVHINALTTDQLPAEVARGYQIARSQNRAMLNVSVRKKANGTENPVPATVNVVVKNLSNQIKDIKLREIRENDPLAIYYIGEVPVNHEETLVFNIDVKPEGENETILLAYRQRFFTQ